MSESVHTTDQVIEAFESAWESGVVQDFESSIPPQARGNTELLVELAFVDLEHRIQHDTETRVESYTTAFPQLASDNLVLLELIRTEYTFRKDRDSQDAESYCQRFPQLRREIELMFQLEFNQSGDSHTRGNTADWRCTACNSVIEGRAEGETCCCDCGQPIAIGRYDLLERVGQGAFGYVYRARDPKLDRVVAIKVPRSSQFLMPEESERFLRESRNAAQLDHPGIVRVFDTGRHDGIPYIVSEFVAGQPLSKRIAESEFEFRDSATLVAEIADAVSHAHQRGVIHRDLKPANIMTGAGPNRIEPRVMDFGLARRDQSDVTVTLEGQAIGTPAFMSPEQARGDLAAVGPKSDVYSLGVVLFQLLCGEVPFRGNVQRLIQQVVHDDPPPPSRFRNRIPRDLETVCMKAINRDPVARYDGVAELRDDLNRWLDGKPIRARRIGPVGTVYRWCCRRPTIAALLAVLMLSLFAGVSGVTWQWRKAEIARTASEADLSDALESVDKVLSHLGSDVLADIPQAKQLRSEVLSDALVFFERFRKRNPDDPRVEMQVARAHYQVARIQSALGKKAEAREGYAAAVAGYEKLEGRAPDTEKWLEEKAWAHSRYASFLKIAGEHDAARKQQRECLKLRMRLHEENPKSGEYAAKFASAKADLGRMLTNANEAEANFDAAIEQLEGLLKDHKGKGGYQPHLARILNNYAIYLTGKGKLGRAEKTRGRAIELLEALIASGESSESRRALYANCCLQLVKSMRGESRLKAALEYQQKAVAAYQSLTEDFPATPKHRGRLATLMSEIAGLARVQKRFDDELKACEEAVIQRKTLVALFPSNDSYKRKLAVDLGDLAGALSASDRKPDAEDRLREKLKLRRLLAEKGSIQSQIDLAVEMRDFALLISKSKSKKKKEEAETLRKESDDVMSKISRDDILATTLSNGRKLGLLDSLSRYVRDENDLEELEKVYRAKIKIYEEGVKLNPEKITRRYGLAKNWYYLAEMLRKTDRKDEAIAAYRKAISLDEQLLKDDPDSASYSSQLISHSSSLGVMLYYGGQPGEGAKVIRRSLDVAKKLFEERQNEGFRQMRVVMAYLQLGEALAIEGTDFQASIDAHNEAVSLLDIVKSQKGMEQFEATVLRSASWLLVTCPDETLRDPKRALELSRRAVKIWPDKASVVAGLGFALYETGDFKAAIEALTKASQLDNRGSALNTMLIALCHARSGDLEQAKRVYDKAVELNAEQPSEPELFEIYREIAMPLVDTPPR